MTIDEKRKQLAFYRLTQADESIDEALFLLKGRKSPRSIINRIYYGMFYSVLALLVFEQYASSKHSGVISFFNKHFIKEGNFPNDPGSYLNKSFALRQRSDYREYIELSYDQVEPYLNKAQEFIDIVKMIINKK